MNQVRNALRAYAVDTQDPARVLARTNTALVQLMPEAMATVLYGVLDVRTGELSYASAGHPPPLLAGPDGSRYLTDGAGMMLGVADRPSYATARDHLPAGSSLLLFSDGLVEDRSRSLDEGLDALASVFSKGEVATAEEACALAQGVMVEGSARADDVCLLAVRVD
jgi:serine phosphatase RsbU (regulator of sigma subunit)